VLRDPDLPDALHEMEGEAAPAYLRSQKSREQRLEALGQVIGAKRDAAVAARKESGIEAIWTAAEEAYLGIDELNRSEFSGSRWAKPTSMGAPLTAERNPNVGKKSTVFVPLTARYVDMAFAKVSEVTLPIDEKAFSIKPTEIPDLASKIADTTPATDDKGNQVLNPQGQPATRGQLLQAQVDVATARAKKEESWVADNFQEAKYPQEMRKVLFDAARIGSGVLKGPTPTLRKAQSFSIVNGQGQLKIEEKIRPGLGWMDVWNLFPAPGCGENIHDGDHLLDRDFFSPRKLRDLKKLKDKFGVPLYLPSQIDKVLEQGPGKVNEEASGGGAVKKQDHKNHFEVFRFYGALTPQDMKDMGAEGAEDLPDDLVEVQAIVELVNDIVIRASINPLESGRFPHKVLVWQRRSGYWAGVGVGERVDVPQKIINGGTRAMLNNAGKSGGSQIVVDRRAIEPADASWDLNTGDKVWWMTGEALVQDVRQIFLTYSIPNMTPQMLTIIDYALKLAEQLTNLPLVSQGQTGKDDPETFGQAELQNNNANVLLRSIAWNVDDSITEPMVNDFHEWYLLDLEVPDEDKGDFQIDAKGSIAMVERAIQEQTYAQLLPLALNPAWGQDPKKLFSQFLKTKRLNPEDTAYSEADLKKIQSTPPPPPPQVQAAQINAATKVHVTEMQGDQRLKEIQAEAQHDQSSLVAGGTTPHEASAMAKIRDSQIRAETARYVEDSRATAEAARAEKELEIARTDGEYRMRELQMQRDILLLTYAQKQNLTLTQVKGQLANTALQLHAKNELQQTDQAFQASENQVDREHEKDLHQTGLEHDMEKHQTGLEADAETAKPGSAGAKDAAKVKAKPAAKAKPKAGK
jgi:hypothetical protein